MRLLILLVTFIVLIQSGNGDRCPGYCGRVSTVANGSTTYSGCQACPWGQRVNPETSVCEQCKNSLPLYGWLYLSFIAILPILLNCFFVRVYAKEESKWQTEASEYFCCFLEGFIAAFSSILTMHPRGSLDLWSCDRTSVYEWYPALNNPQYYKERTLHCTYEVVYPLYSLPFIYYFFQLVAMLFLRSILYVTLRRGDRSSRAYYAALYSLPIIALVHALLAGMLYHLFATVLVFYSVMGNAVHLALEGYRPIGELARRLLSSAKHITILVMHMLLLAFAIVTIAIQRQDEWALVFVILVPLPPVFYLLTAGLSHPSQITFT